MTQTPTKAESLAARAETLAIAEALERRFGCSALVLTADIERAAAELRRLSAENTAAVSSFLAADDERRELRTERDALRADAERYRWLRERYQILTHEIPAKALGLDLRRLYVNTREKFDAVIDAARATGEHHE